MRKVQQFRHSDKKPYSRPPGRPVWRMSLQYAPATLIESITNFLRSAPFSSTYCSVTSSSLSNYYMCSNGCFRSDLMQQTVQTNWSDLLKTTAHYFTSVRYHSTSHKDTDSLICLYCSADVLLIELIINTHTTRHNKNWENEPIVQQYAIQRQTKLALRSVPCMRHIKTHFKYVMARISYCTYRLCDITAQLKRHGKYKLNWDTADRNWIRLAASARSQIGLKFRSVLPITKY
jgi:hypothetical protein